MKITVLLRYPKVERAAWKQRLLSELIERGHGVSLVFGETSYLQHARAALKEYGVGFLNKQGEIQTAARPRLIDHFRALGCPTYNVPDLNGPRAERLLRQIGPDLLILLGTGIIRQPILEVPRRGTIHCHHGYLPDFRGVNTVEWSIYHGHDVYITTHYVDPGIDTGRILLRKPIPVQPTDTISDVRRHCQEGTVELILETVDRIEAGAAEPEHQDMAAGHQYFTMHPFFRDLVSRILRTEPADRAQTA